MCSPKEAYQCFMNTGMDILVLQDHIYVKEEQIHWKEDMNVNGNFKLD